MARSDTFQCAHFALVAVAVFACSACSDSAPSDDDPGGNGGEGATQGAGGEPGPGGASGAGGSSGTSGCGGGGATGGADPSPKQEEVLFVGGFMSEFYESLSLHLEDELNRALVARARTLNVRIDLPLDRSIDIPVGGALGGNGESLDDLKTAGREAYMAARVVAAPNAPDIGDLTSAIPVISAYSTYEAGGTVTGFASAFASSILNAGVISQITQIVVDNYWDTPLDIPGVISRSTTAAVNLVRQRVATALDAAVATIGLMDLTNVYMNSIVGVPNDGLVPRDSTALPGAIHRGLDLGDHASPVMDVDPLHNFWTAQRRNEVTASLVDEVRDLAEDP